MLQAMNTGHEGSMSTVHANTPIDAISRLETMVLMGGTDLPARAILKQIASAVDVLVQVSRLRGGQRKIVAVAEVAGLEDGEVRLRHLYEYRQIGVGLDGRPRGFHAPTGQRSIHLDRFQANGEDLPVDIFEAPPVASREALR
jgi:pilus assembly protein CpaF